jgi:hypothetical protein
MNLVKEAEANLEENDNYWKENHAILKGVMDSV